MRFCFGDAPKTEAAAERMLENIATTPRAERLALAVFDATPRSPSQARFSRRVTRAQVLGNLTTELFLRLFAHAADDACA